MCQACDDPTPPPAPPRAHYVTRNDGMWLASAAPPVGGSAFGQISDCACHAVAPKRWERELNTLGPYWVPRLAGVRLHRFEYAGARGGRAFIAVNRVRESVGGRWRCWCVGRGVWGTDRCNRGFSHRPELPKFRMHACDAVAASGNIGLWRLDDQELSQCDGGGCRPAVDLRNVFGHQRERRWLDDRRRLLPVGQLPILKRPTQLIAKDPGWTEERAKAAGVYRRRTGGLRRKSGSCPMPWYSGPNPSSATPTASRSTATSNGGLPFGAPAIGMTARTVGSAAWPALIPTCRCALPRAAQARTTAPRLSRHRVEKRAMQGRAG